MTASDRSLRPTLLTPIVFPARSERVRFIACFGAFAGCPWQPRLPRRLPRRSRSATMRHYGQRKRSSPAAGARARDRGPGEDCGSGRRTARPAAARGHRQRAGHRTGCVRFRPAASDAGPDRGGAGFPQSRQAPRQDRKSRTRISAWPMPGWRTPNTWFGSKPPRPGSRSHMPSSDWRSPRGPRTTCASWYRSRAAPWRAARRVPRRVGNTPRIARHRRCADADRSRPGSGAGPPETVHRRDRTRRRRASPIGRRRSRDAAGDAFAKPRDHPGRRGRGSRASRDRPCPCGQAARLRRQREPWSAQPRFRKRGLGHGFGDLADLRRSAEEPR